MMTDDVHLPATALIAASRAVRTSSDLGETTAALVAVADALRSAGTACDALACSVIPDHVAGSISDRYRSAADAWPASVRPSHEQLAAILTALHDTAAAARLTARRCDAAVVAVSATAGLHHASR